MHCDQGSRSERRKRKNWENIKNHLEGREGCVEGQSSESVGMVMRSDSVASWERSELEGQLQLQLIWQLFGSEVAGVVLEGTSEGHTERAHIRVPPLRRPHARATRRISLLPIRAQVMTSRAGFVMRLCMPQVVRL